MKSVPAQKQVNEISAVRNLSWEFSNNTVLVKLNMDKRFSKRWHIAKRSSIKNSRKIGLAEIYPSYKGFGLPITDHTLPVIFAGISVISPTETWIRLPAIQFCKKVDK